MDTLSDVDPGDTFQIVTIPDDRIRAQLQRMGFLDGAVECRQQLRKGPVIIRRHGTQMAIGASVARAVEVAFGRDLDHD